VKRDEKLLSIFVTAGFPELDSTEDIILTLDKVGVDFIELGIPFSDPIADGPVIQKASDIAIRNGISLDKIFDMLQNIRKASSIPIILMGYLNPVHKMGIKSFIQRAQQVAIDGLILPDWNLEESTAYQTVLTDHDIDLIQLIAPNTAADRIRKITDLSRSFIYCVAYTGLTGQDKKITPQTVAFLKNLRRLTAQPLMVGFGVKNKQDFQTYTKYADGVIIGSEFINLLEKTPPDKRPSAIEKFIKNIRV
jgi:tryptophan synthase alpha chain